MGTPDPSFGFVRILEVMLRRHYPGRRIEVVNAAMRGINSHVIEEIAKECAGLNPDLFVVYVGNNEFNGLYGPGTSLELSWQASGPDPGFPLCQADAHGPVASHGARGQSGGPSEPQGGSRGGVVPGSPHRVGRSRAGLRLPQFPRQSRANLPHAMDAGAGVIVSTIGVNLRDCPPLGSLHRTDLTASQREQWERLCREGMQFERAGDAAQALSRYREALEIDDHYAELHFRVARCQLRAGEVRRRPAPLRPRQGLGFAAISCGQPDQRDHSRRRRQIARRFGPARRDGQGSGRKRIVPRRDSRPGVLLRARPPAFCGRLPGCSDDAARRLSRAWESGDWPPRSLSKSPRVSSVPVTWPSRRGTR